VIGTVIEAEVDKSKGTIATLLVQNGTLEAGSIVVAGKSYGRMKAMTDYKASRSGKSHLPRRWWSWA